MQASNIWARNETMLDNIMTKNYQDYLINNAIFSRLISKYLLRISEKR